MQLFLPVREADSQMKQNKLSIILVVNDLVEAAGVKIFTEVL